ncbi:MAG TPA: hypothetical protein PKO01_04635 [Smithellaceae bacterium]|nr:hypothetical protein [Smithellaceae bacterium]HPH55855.1 hypothetical protein [Smithella sp.]HPN87640.1 hypothetical protein [Smithella sp.]HQB93550.1 hypothetical protein [Smithellaceae bacterium]
MNREFQSVKISEIRAGFKGRPFSQLVDHHLRRQSQDQRIQGINDTIAMFPEQARGLVEGFIDRWNLRAYKQVFWRMNTASVFDEIMADAKNVLDEAGLQPDDETLFNMFNIIVLSYAHRACDQPKMREFMGLRASVFPWISAVSLLYPIAAGIYVATKTPASAATIVGYFLANLGYLLVGAGMIKGTFKIFALKKRWHVLGAGALAFLVGTFLSNIGP